MLEMRMQRGLGCSWMLALGAAMLAASSALAGADTEVRDFDILVDGKPAGQSRVTLVQEDDGSVYMKATVAVKLQTLLPYSFSIDAQEWWKGGKLVSLKSSAQENKKRNEVFVSGDGKQLTVNA